MFFVILFVIFALALALALLGYVWFIHKQELIESGQQSPDLAERHKSRTAHLGNSAHGGSHAEGSHTHG